MQTLGEFQLFLQNGDQDIDTDSNPDLGENGILGGPVEGLDSQVLLDPLEEQLYLPPAFVEEGDTEGWKGEIVRQEG